MIESSNTNISVLIITLNEENQMQTLLADLDFADEIIVVDSFSTDKTEAICKSFPKVKFFQNTFKNYPAQRNYAISLAQNDWILFLDADERLTPELKSEILETTQQKTTSIAFQFRRKFMFKHKVLHFSGCQNDKIFRLFHKGFATYATEKLVHEKLITNGKTAVFKNKLIHYSYPNYGSYKAKIIRYGELKAQEKFMQNDFPSILFQYLHPAYNFLFNYIVRLGFLDGKKGITICYLNAYSVFIRYKRLRILKITLN
ncbi:glycosyltransferase family 2 protein [Flavobacterium sp. WC2409]|uniref:Glycosyltransferase family 2 protein n=3 Tax=unclassified Flavobacterium TaxID=196869 RepID=A0AB39WAP6_9FLAO